MSNENVSKKYLDGIKQIWSKYSIIFVFIILFLICTLLTGGKFGEWKNVSTILRNASTIGIIALGMTFVIISGGIDLSSGPVMATAGLILVILQGNGTPLFRNIARIAVTTAFGFINGIITTKIKVPRSSSRWLWASSPGPLRCIWATAQRLRATTRIHSLNPSATAACSSPRISRFPRRSSSCWWWQCC